MNLLYLSCHSVLEFDELRIFSELGIDVFSHGAYHNPKKVDDKKRPALDLPYHEEFSKKVNIFPKENLDPDLVRWADVIVVMHIDEWIFKNFSKLKGKRILWRSIGQCVTNNENMLRILRREGVELIRYSPRERTIPGFAGEDYLIRFGKDISEYGPWSFKKEQIITFAQSMKRRDPFCNWSIFDKATFGYPRKVYGPGNGDLGVDDGGLLSYSDLLRTMRESKMYFYTGTYPASYTLNFIEAALSGLPMVALGNILGNSTEWPGQETYEVADLLRRYEAGFTGDSIEELRKKVEILWNDLDLCKKFSKNIREMAVDLFDKEKIKEQWRKVLFG